MGLGEAGTTARERTVRGRLHGLLVIPAGLLLVGIGFVTLWRSRKGGSLVRRFLRRTAVGLGLLSARTSSCIRSRSRMSSPTARAYVPEPIWAPPTRCSFTTADGLRLEGWYVPSKNGANVIVFPRSQGPQKPARILARHGYGVLLFDRRGEGARARTPNMPRLGRNPRLDAAISYLGRGPTSTTTASAGSACRSAGRCSCRRLPRPTT